MEFALFPAQVFAFIADTQSWKRRERIEQQVGYLTLTLGMARLERLCS